MTENDENKKTIYQDEKTEQKDGETTTTKRKSIMEVNPDGSTTITNSVVSTTVKNEIKLDENTKVNVSEIDAHLEDKKYIEAMRAKNQLAVLKDSNQMICNIPLSAAEDILKKMGASLENDFNIFAFGIYSLEEINEIRKSMAYEKPKKVFTNVIKDFDVIMTPIEKNGRIKKKLDNIIFKVVKERLDMIRAEEERIKQEEEERLRKLEEEKQLKMLEKQKRKEKACNKLKKIREENILEILKKKFAQYRQNCEQLRLIEQSRTVETEKKVLRLKIKRDSVNGVENPEDGNKEENGENQTNLENEEEQKRLEEEKKKKEEEEEEKKKEEEERLKKEEEERLKKEEEEKLKKEEEEKKKKEEEERLKKEEEERLKNEQEELNRQKEEEEKRKKEEEENERLRQQQKELNRQKEEEEKRKKEEQSLEQQKLEQAELDMKKEIEEKRKKEEEENEKLKQQQEELNRQKEEEEKKKKEEEEKEREKENKEGELYSKKEGGNNEEDPNKKLENENKSLTKDTNEQPTKLRAVKSKNQSSASDSKNNGLNNDSNNNDDSNVQKEETMAGGNEDDQKPKKKKVLKKVKKIVKVPKKKQVIENRKPFYISASSIGGGAGDYHDNVTYTGHKPLYYLNKKNECTSCHHEIPERENKIIQNKDQNPNNNDDLYVCDNCIHRINPITNQYINTNLNNINNNHDNNLKSNNLNNNINYNNGSKTTRYDNYKNYEDDKYDPINAKEFFEMNRNRYLNELWKKENEDSPKGKKGLKSRSIEKMPKNEFDKEQYNVNKNENDNNEAFEPRKIKRCRNKSLETMHKPIEKDYNKNNPYFYKQLNSNLKNNLKGGNYDDVKEIECPKCRNVYILTPEKRFYYCTDCQNIMCGKCSKKHYVDNPDHNCSKADLNKPDIQEIMTAFSYTLNNNNNKNNVNNRNLNNNIDNNNSNVKSPRKRKLNVRKYLNKNQNDPNLIISKNSGQGQYAPNDNLDNENNNYYPNNNNNYDDLSNNLAQEGELYNINSNNKGLLRNKPNNKLLSYDKNYQTNNYIRHPDNEKMLKGDYYSGFLDEGNCFICGIKKKELPKGPFYLCRECDHLVCYKCRGRHDDVHPNHNLVTSYISGEINNLDNDNNKNLRSGPKIIKHYDYYKEYINPSNNNYYNENSQNNLNPNEYEYEISQEYEGDNNYNNNNPNIQNNINSNIPNNINPNIQNNINQNALNNQKYYYTNIPPNNIDDNQSQYYINKNKNNIDNINNLDNNNINNNSNNIYKINANKNYSQNEFENDYPSNINAFRSYNFKDNTDDNMGLSPNKRRQITIRRYNNERYNNQDDNINDNNDQIIEEGQNINDKNDLRNINNQNIFKKRKCKIEFDIINKKDSEFEGCQIFGFPACYNCLRSKKKEKTLQIFYCSQCMKLYCKDCLYLHNYCN